VTCSATRANRGLPDLVVGAVLPVSPSRTVLRLVVVTAQAATILITWPLWQPRTEPPLLPLIELPAWPFGLLLLVSLALAVVRPVAGVLAHVGLLTVAIVADQTREQPQVLSLAVLLAATMQKRGACEIGALHLVALWLWSGIGKLTSGRFLAHGGAWIVFGPETADTQVDPTASIAAGVSVGAVEVALALLVLVPRTRRGAAWAGAVLHLAILALLSPLGRDWNPAVWPWNAALAIGSVLLLGQVEGGPRAMLRRCGPATRALAAMFFALPVGFHLGLVDGPLAFQVYAQNTCHAIVLRADGRTEIPGRIAALRVLMPPVPRILLVWFLRTGGPGDRMILVDDRPLGAVLGPRERIHRFEDVKGRQ
jgi:hypothetical protein